MAAFQSVTVSANAAQVTAPKQSTATTQRASGDEAAGGVCMILMGPDVFRRIGECARRVTRTENK
jgi:hypothetical protein